MAKKFYSLFMLFLAIIAGIGGVCFAIYQGEYPLAIAIAALVYMAWPAIKSYINELKS